MKTSFISDSSSTWALAFSRISWMFKKLKTEDERNIKSKSKNFKFKDI